MGNAGRILSTMRADDKCRTIHKRITYTRERERKQMTTKEQTCEERIESQLTNLEESVTDILKAYHEDEEGYEAWNNFPLSVETRKETKILLSWGGPSDFLSVVHDGTDIFTVTYHFQDWFDGASRSVDGDSKIWEYAQTVIEAREECGY